LTGDYTIAALIAGTYKPQQMIQQGFGGIVLPGKKITLRDYQLKAKKEIRTHYAMGVKRVLLVLPTGGGKTVVFSDIAYDVAARKKYVLVLAHRIELLEQCGNKLHENGVDFGYLNPKYTEKRSAHVQVGTMQTVVNRLKKMGVYPDLIIIDEAHRSMSKTYREIIAHFEKSLLLGVTATPIRGDNKCLGDIYEVIVEGPSVKELISRGALVQPITYAPLGHLDLSGAPIINGEFDRKWIEKKMNKPGITGDAITHYKTICDGHSAVAFCASIDHAKSTAADFCEAGYKFLSIDGTMENRERFHILEMLRTREIHGITSVDLVTEGLDVPSLTCGLMLRPTNGEGLYMQMGGRVLRPFPGKDLAFILDHAGLAVRHGLLTEERQWTLDPEEFERRKRKKSEEKNIKIKQCPTCYNVHEPAPACPRCGHVYRIIGRAPDVTEGSLQEVTAEAEDMIKKARKSEVKEAKTLEDLKSIEKLRGYKPRIRTVEQGGDTIEGWAEHVFAARNNKDKMV
jgi:DNA repair protein RadD